MIHLKKALIVIAFLTTTIASAQQTSFGISGMLAQPFFSNNQLSIDESTSAGWGFVGQINHKLENSPAAIVAKLGYVRWKTMNVVLVTAGVTAIPFSIGGKYYIRDGWYAGLDVGAHYMKPSINAIFLISLSTSRPETLFSFAPNLGVEFDLGKTVMDIGLNYSWVGGKYNYLGIRAGFLLNSK